MDIEFIEEEHRDNIFKIMELCNCQMAEAYQLYNNHGCNVQNAVQAKFNSLSNDHYMEPSYNKPSPFENSNYQGGKSFQNNALYNVDYDDQYERFRIFKSSGIDFPKRYQVRKDNGGFIKGLLNNIIVPQNSFKKSLEEYIGKKSILKLSIGSISQSLQSIWKSKFPLLVHILDFNSPASVRENIKNLYNDQVLVAMMSEQFQNVGLNSKQYKLQNFLKQFINLPADANSLVIFKVNAMDQVVMLSKFPIVNITVKQLKTKIKQIKSQCINTQLEETHLQLRYKEQLNGNFDYQKPMTIMERKKLKQDREIRKKQEEEFYAASMQPKKEENKPSMAKQVASQKHQIQSKVQVVKKDPKKVAFEQRKAIRERLKLYENDGEDMIAIKLRLPSSQLKKLYVHSKERAQYLYDYVLSREQGLGFEEDETKREFDIVEPYEKINLSQRKEEMLGKIFQGQTMLSLVVSQKTG